MIEKRHPHRSTSTPKKKVYHWVDHSNMKQYDLIKFHYLGAVTYVRGGINTDPPREKQAVITISITLYI